MIEPLLEIRTVPVSFELKVNNARYEMATTDATFELRRDKGGLQMKMRPARLNIDTIEARYSAGIKSAMRSVADSAQRGIQAAYKATASYSREGDLMLNVDFMNNPIPEIAMRKFFSDVDFNLGFSPEVGPDISWDTGGISMNFEMDKLNFDWDIQRPHIEFTPGSVELIIKEYPRIEVNYVGSPIYIPPSADPEYKEIDTFV